MVIPCDLFAETGGKAFGGVSLSGFVLFDRVSETAEFAILKLLEYQVRKTNRKDLLLRSFLTIVFAELADSGQNDLSWELLLNEYFETYCRTASLSEFAAMKNYQVNYASRLIKKHTGKSFSELLSAYRIDRAKRLLTDGTLPVEEIAAEVGYKTPSGLYKQFFSCVGMNPAEYRRLFR